jgi:hypothetical protein
VGFGADLGIVQFDEWGGREFASAEEENGKYFKKVKNGQRPRGLFAPRRIYFITSATFFGGRTRTSAELRRL